MNDAVAVLADRVQRGAADLHNNYAKVNADKRRLLQRTFDTVAVLDGSTSSYTALSHHTAATDCVLPLLTLLPVDSKDTAPQQQLDARDGGLGMDEDEATSWELDVLSVEAVYEGGQAGCDGRWAVSAIVRSRARHTLNDFQLTALTASKQAQLACHSPVIHSLPTSSIVCLLATIDVLASTSVQLADIGALLTVSHQAANHTNTTTTTATATAWNRLVQLPRFPYAGQRLLLLAPSTDLSLDESVAPSLSPLSAAPYRLALRLDASPPIDALSALIQQRLQLRPVVHAEQHRAVCGVAEAKLTASDELLVSAVSADSPRVCPFPGVCCLLSARPSVAPCCALQLYALNGSVALSCIACLRSALPATCTLLVDAINPMSLLDVQGAMVALLAETEEAVSSLTPLITSHTSPACTPVQPMYHPLSLLCLTYPLVLSLCFVHCCLAFS